MAYAIHRYRDLIATPWRNGGGVTREIAAWPPGADMWTFDWRVSLATVAGAGPFSAFPGTDRILTVVEGSLDIALADAPRRRLVGTSPPFAFPGEAAAWAEAPEGSATDYNVMSRRGRIVAEVTRLRGLMTIDLPAGGWVVILATGAGGLSIGAKSEHLERLDTLLADAREAPLKVILTANAGAILARLRVA